jgi:hypothetical protein
MFFGREAGETARQIDPNHYVAGKNLENARKMRGWQEQTNRLRMEAGIQ